MKEARERAAQTNENPELAAHAAVIRRIVERIKLKDLVEIGRRLVESKKIVGHGGWAQWLEREFKWTDRTALNFMRVYEAAKSEKFSDLMDLNSDLNIPVSALYLLTRPNTPEEVRDKVLDDFKAGETITVNGVKDALKEAQEPGAKTGKPDGNETDKANKGNQKWFNSVRRIANDAIDAANFVDPDKSKLTEDQLADLRKVIEASKALLPTWLEGARALIKLHAFGKKLIAEPPAQPMTDPSVMAEAAE
jgi:hypothetical protein